MHAPLNYDFLLHFFKEIALGNQLAIQAILICVHSLNLKETRKPQPDSNYALDLSPFLVRE